jgi:beta-galactosidase
VRHLFVYYRALQRIGIPVDIISSSAPVTNYKLLIAPTLHLADAALATKLTEFVQAGGTLVMGVRSGFKSTSGTVTSQPLPGMFRDLAGVTVTGWGALPGTVRVEVESEIPGLSGMASLWIEALQPLPGAEVRAQYASGPYAGRGALTETVLGKGRALYCGWFLEAEQAAALLAHLASQLNIERLAELPPGLIAARRGAYTILLNFTDRPLAAEVNRRLVTVPGRDVQIVLDPA